jgi:hypothetical protein
MYVSFANFINAALFNAPNGVIRPALGRAAGKPAANTLPGTPPIREELLNPYPYADPAEIGPNFSRESAENPAGV